MGCSCTVSVAVAVLVLYHHAASVSGSLELFDQLPRSVMVRYEPFIHCPGKLPSKVYVPSLVGV